MFLIFVNICRLWCRQSIRKNHKGHIVIISLHCNTKLYKLQLHVLILTISTWIYFPDSHLLPDLHEILMSKVQLSICLSLFIGRSQITNICFWLLKVIDVWHLGLQIICLNVSTIFSRSVWRNRCVSHTLAQFIVLLFHILDEER